MLIRRMIGTFGLPKSLQFSQDRIMIARFLLLSTLVFSSYVSFAQRQNNATSENTRRLKDALAQFPEADANGDGILTQQEARLFARGQGNVSGSVSRAATTARFAPSDEIIANLIESGRANNNTGPLQFEKGDGIRLLMAGHSWVRPGERALPGIVKAAGVSGHHQRAHMGGGGTGSANSIWLKEFGEYDSNPPRPILLPALATGEWDAMSWGPYYQDIPEFYSQWIELCLRYNPDMKFYIQEPWPRLDHVKGDVATMDSEELLDFLRNDFAEWKAEFQRLADQLNRKYDDKVQFIPVGTAVFDLIEGYYAGKIPEFDCLDERIFGGKRGIYRDGSHLARSGTDLIVGYTYYSTLYGKSTEGIEGIRPEGVPTGLDLALRQAAWKAVSEQGK